MEVLEVKPDSSENSEGIFSKRNEKTSEESSTKFLITAMSEDENDEEDEYEDLPDLEDIEDSESQDNGAAPTSTEKPFKPMIEILDDETDTNKQEELPTLRTSTSGPSSKVLIEDITASLKDDGESKSQSTDSNAKKEETTDDEVIERPSNKQSE